MSRYNPSSFESKWQDKWQEERLYSTDLKSEKPKYYLLVEFPYPSGDLHIGHWFAFSVPDILARLKRMQGYNVLYPFGFDAFGLPAENAAIKWGYHPRDWTHQNITRMKDQLKMTGGTFDFNYSVITCDPEFYKWNQWIFLKMFDKGLAYKGQTLSNWCPNCATVLANENVEKGLCWRCGTEVVQKEVEQWFLRITEYADRLEWNGQEGVDWPKPTREAQNNWIGRKTGVVINYLVEGKDCSISVFTTRPDTNFGATFIAISPEHPDLKEITNPDNLEEVEAYLEVVKRKSELERKENREKTGVFTGSYAINNLSGERMPIWVSDFVLMGFGTGALVGVPGHDKRDFEFADKFSIPIKRVVIGSDGDQSPITKIEQVQEEEGVMVNSDFLDGLDIHLATKKITDYLVEKGWGEKKVIYNLHDWSISRQRYWGTPIPIIYCQSCGMVPVPEADLPIELPYEVDYAPKGKAPLATAEEWVKAPCPKCGEMGQREVETLDTFFDSSWYFLRYLDPKNEERILNEELVKKWLPVDVYFGGSEHTLGHTLYSRFFTKFFKDLGLIDLEEYALRRVNHGIILGPDGARMSKSKGNVVNPDEQVKLYGADAVRTYLAFLGPYDLVAPWNPSGMQGVYHFLERVWELGEKSITEGFSDEDLTNEDLFMMHKTIKKVGSDIENIKFNTGVAALMEWLNYLSKKSHDSKVNKAEMETLLILLAPFAPHLTEELWQKIVSRESIHQQSWPEVVEEYLTENEVEIAIMVNGKLRDSIKISSDMIDNQSEVEKLAQNTPNILKWTEGKEIKKVIYVPGRVLNLVV